MPYGTVKVDNITFDNGGTDQNVTVSGIHRAITSGVTVTGTISGVTLIGTTTVSGATVTGTTVQGTTIQGVSGTFTSLTGTTTTGTTANFVSGVFTTQISGATITGTTARFTSGTFVSLTGTTITGTTVNATTVSSTTGTFGSITGTVITGTTVNSTTVNSVTGSFTSLTGVTVTGTTAQFASGVFTTSLTATTLSGNGALLTALNASNLSAGTVAETRLPFQPVQQGGGAGQGTSKVYIGWNGSNLALQVDTTSFGATWPIAITGNASTVTTNANLTGDVTSVGNATSIASGVIVNADINASAAIVDTKLATISTAGKVNNSATTATDANTASAIVARSASGNFDITSINNGPLAGFRNAIINGNFDHWQRGTSQTTNGYGSADRWFMYAVGGTFTASRQSFALGQTAVPGEPTYFYRTVTVFAAGALNERHLTQHIEDVRTFAGQQVTVSFWAKADAAKNISIEFEQIFGTGGSPSANISAIGVVKVALTTSWQKITRTVSISSISGKTLGTDGNSYLQCNIWFDAGSSFNARTDTLGQQSGTFDIAQVQLEAGPVATPFERRPIGTELALCQRYYHLLRQNMFSSGNANIARVHVQFPTSMRTTPTVSLTTNSGGALDWACPEFAQFYKGGAGVSIEVVPPTTFTAEL